MSGLDSSQIILIAILAVICLVLGLADLTIFGFWFNYRYKMYQMEKMYGPTLTFPPRKLQTDTSEDPRISEVDEYTQLQELPDDTYPVAIDLRITSATGGLRSPFASTWSLTHPFLGFQLIVLIVNILASVVLIPVMFSGGKDYMTTPTALTAIIVTLFLQNAGFVGFTMWCLKSYKCTLNDIGFRAPTFREVGLGLIFGVIVLFVSSGLETGINTGLKHILPKTLYDSLASYTDQLSAGGMFEKIKSTNFKLLFALAGSIAAPIGEEFFFRGLLYNGLKRRSGIATAVVVSGVCFALIHFAPLAVIAIIPMGILLALAYQYTGSLWVTIIMHAVNNSVAFGLMWKASNPRH